MVEKILIVSDSFKGSATSLEVGQAIAQGIRSVDDSVELEVVAIADGGEGTVASIISSIGGEFVEMEVTGPMGKAVQSRYGIKDTSAYLEVAETSGLALLNSQDLQPRFASTYGLGEQILDAMSKGCTTVYIGLGGSATNDAGIGMARALGYRFLDSNKQELTNDVFSFETIESIDDKNVDPRLKVLQIHVLTDVQNPLCGSNGASAIYGPQKGVLKGEIERFDSSLLHLGKIMESYASKDILDVPGAGAAGGLGAGLIALTHAEINNGMDTMIEILKLEDKIKNADLVITGEGRIDAQTKNGKVPYGIAKVAKKFDKPVIAIVGSQSEDAHTLKQDGIDLILDIINEPMTLDSAFTKVCELLSITGIHAYNAWTLSEKYKRK